MIGRYPAATQAAYRRDRAAYFRTIGHESCARRYDMLAAYFEQPWWRRLATWPVYWWRNLRWPRRDSEDVWLALKWM